MSTTFKRAIFGVIFITLLGFTPNLLGQQSDATTPAPFPAQIAAAKKIFLANGAGDSDPEISKYTGGPDGLYNQFYDDIKNLGRYQLVASPSDADLVLELTVTYASFDRGFSYPKFRVEIKDPRTNVLLWSLTERVEGALLAKNGRRNVSDALARLSNDLKRFGA